MSEDNKRIARRFIDAFSTGDTTLLKEVMAEDAVDHNPPPGGTSGGRQAVAGIIAAYRAAFSDMEICVEREVAEGHCIAAPRRRTSCPS
jgi:ketosteroid isomerase-like protein